MADEGKSDQPDDSEPTPERQAELRAAYEANVAVGKAPYERVAIRTRGELLWVMRERDWSGEYDAEGKERANLSWADLRFANLSGANLFGANLSWADLYGATLSGADLNEATLSGAHLGGANLSGAHLSFANLSGANLIEANLGGADLRQARMDVDTRLAGIVLDTKTRLRDVTWNSVPLTQVDWGQTVRRGVARLGDERAIAQAKKREDRISAYHAATRAYRQLATILRDQGLNEEADSFAYRAQVLQRRMRWHQGQPLPWFGSLVLWLVAGYGYRPLRSFVTYAVVILGFAAAYFALGSAGGKAIAWNEAIVISMTAFHGRGFFSAVFQPGDLQAAVAAVEAFFGLLIEIIFIATFTQRFFAR